MIGAPSAASEKLRDTRLPSSRPSTQNEGRDNRPAGPLRPVIAGAAVNLGTQIKATLWKAKTRLQFTGWLQYIPTATAAVACFLVATAGWAIGHLRVVLFWPPFVVGSILLLVFILDVCTLKFGLRPSEPLPGRMDELGAFDLMRARRACRSFQNRNLTAADRAELMECVRIHSQPAGLLGDHPIRFEYVAAPLTVWPVVGGHEFLVAIAPRDYDRMAVIDVGRSLQKVVIHATRMGLATCWIGPGADHESIVAHLGSRLDLERDHIICVCAVGYASRFLPLPIRLISRIQRRRLPLSSLFFADPEFQRPLDTDSAPFNRFGRCYEVCQWSPSSFNAQPTRCVGVVERTEGGECRVRFDFYASTASRFYAPVALGIWCANWETGCSALGIPGRFVELKPEARSVHGATELPRYDVSWVLDPTE
jgi:nitroreductase